MHVICDIQQNDIAKTQLDLAEKGRPLGKFTNNYEKKHNTTFYINNFCFCQPSFNTSIYQKAASIVAPT